MGLISELGRLSDLAYDAGAGERSWDEFVDATGQVFDAIHCVLTTEAADRGFGMAEGGASHLWVQYHCGSYGGSDPLMERAWRLPRGTVSLVQQIDEDPVLGRSDFYRSFLAHNGLRHFMHVLLPQGPGRVAFFCLTRDARRPTFSAEEIEAVEALMQHLKRALRMGNRITSGTSEASLFEASPYGLVLLDADGQVVARNSLARQIAASAEGITLDGGTVHLSGLRSELAALVRSRRASNGAITPVTFRVDRAGIDLPLSALLTGVPAEWQRFDGRETAALLVLSDPLTTCYPDAEVLIEHYGLTPREASFAQTLVETRGLRPTSDELGISPETARRHLKSIFEKTRTHSQSELIHLLVRHPAAVARTSVQAVALRKAS